MYLECLIAMMAAMKKVLSPISDTMITDIDAAKPCRKRELDLAAGTSFSISSNCRRKYNVRKENRLRISIR